MEVGRTDGVHGPGRIQGKKPVGQVSSSQGPSAPVPTDRLELSDKARFISEILSQPKVRDDKVQNIRRLIESGTFEDPERLRSTVDRFLEENSDLL